MVEVGLAVVFLMVLISGVYSAARSAGDAFQVMSQKTNIQANVRSMMEEVIEDLKQAGDVTIDRSDPYGDAVLYRLPVKVKIDGVEWGAFVFNESNGKRLGRNQGWQRLLVKTVIKKKYRPRGKGRDSKIHTTITRALVRQSLDHKGNKIGDDEILGTCVDMIEDGKKRFSVTRNGRLVTIRINFPSMVGTGNVKRQAEQQKQPFVAATTVHAANWEVDTSR